MEEDQTLDCDYGTQSYDFKTQFVIRLLVLIVAWCCSFLILIACLCSRKLKFWPFRLLALQTFCKCVVLLGAIVLSNQSKCYPILCGFAGYIMHSSWLTSFICTFLMVYVYYLTINFDNNLDEWKQKLQGWKFLFLLFLTPLIWLALPLLLGYFGPSGWKLNDAKSVKVDRFTVFCGYSLDETNFTVIDNDNRTLFLTTFIITFLLPMMGLFGVGSYLSCKAQYEIEDFEQRGIDNEELKFIKGIQRFPRIYAGFWLINSFLRIFDILNPDWSPNENQGWYFIYVSLNLMHELHMLVILCCFYHEFKIILNLKRIWLNAFCYCRIYNVEYLEVSVCESSLIISHEFLREKSK